jgi:hypothetical protein
MFAVVLSVNCVTLELARANDTIEVNQETSQAFLPEDVHVFTVVNW